MEHYLYFSEGNGADAAGDSVMYPASRFRCVEPTSATTTTIFFRSGIGHSNAGGGDALVITHADTHATAGSYHRAKLIAEEMATLINAGPHKKGTVTTVIDMNTNSHFGRIDTIKGDASFGLAITLDS